jgi:hypothetical protein
MPSNCTRQRIEWVPGSAALDALEAGADLFPGLGRQAVIDRLVIVGASAYLAEPWRIPELPGKSRHKWRLPANLAAKLKPGKGGG